MNYFGATDARVQSLLQSVYSNIYGGVWKYSRGPICKQTVDLINFRLRHVVWSKTASKVKKITDATELAIKVFLG